MQSTLVDTAVGTTDPVDNNGREPSRGGSPLLPSIQELQAEWAEYYTRLAAGEVDPAGDHFGEYVAFSDGRVHDFGSDPTELRQRVASRLGVHPERLVVSHLGD